MTDRTAILIVEDEVLIRMAAVEIAEAAGLAAIEAGNADEAIAILDARKDIRIVFTDIEMPGSMDGIKLAHYIAKRWPPILLVVASGRAIVAESELPSSARFFPKPFDEHLIGETLQEMARSLPKAAPQAGN